MHGFVEDAKEVIGNARILLAPLNFGAGIKGKLVDAMQCYTPSITTEIGSEGLLPLADNIDNVRELWPGAINNIQNSCDSFIESCIALYSNEDKWTQASMRSHTLYSSIFNYERQSRELSDSIAMIRANLTKHRHQHFVGQVLQHHTLNSTKYMSQWIEAKTRLQQAQQ